MNKKKIFVKEDCFAYDCKEKEDKKKCKALNNLFCKNENCPFYKTVEEERKCRRKYGYNLVKEYERLPINLQ